MGVLERIREVMRNSTTDEFAALLGENPQRLKDIFRGKTKPPIDLLQKVHEKCGVDLNWLVTGDGASGMTLSVRESTLIDRYRLAAEAGRAAIEATAAAVCNRPGSGLPSTGKKVVQTFHGSVGQSVTGDVTAPQTINVGSAAKRKARG